MLEQLESLVTPAVLRIQTQEGGWNYVSWGAAGCCPLMTMENAHHLW